MAASNHACCPICASARAAFLCTSCVNRQSFGDEAATSRLELLREQRDALRAMLEQRLGQRAATDERAVQRWQLEQQLNETLARAQRARDALADAERRLASLSASNATRRTTLERLSSSAAGVRTEALSALPTLLRYQSLTHSHVSAMLLREQRQKLRELVEVLPLRVSALRGGGGGPVHIAMRDVRLPHSGVPPVGGWPEPQATSAALGDLLLFVDQVGRILGGPLLHESSHKCSTSSVWQPASFWHRRSAGAGAVLPLYVDGGAGSSTSSGGGGGGGVRPAGAGSSSAARGHGVGGGGGAWALSRADSLGSSPSPGGVSTAAATAAAVAYAGAAAAAAAFGRAAGLDAAVIPAAVSGAATGAAAMTQVPGARRSEPGDFKTAWELLQRSLACFLRDKAATTGMQLPAAWPPLAWLAVLCAAVKRDGRPDGKLVAASNAADQQPTDVDQAQQALDSSSFGGRGGGGSALDASDAVHLSDEDEWEDEGGWGFVQGPLPPPPSQPDAVEHWARAMYADGNALAGGASPAAAAAAHAAAAAGSGLPALGTSPGSGMMSLERVRSLFGK